MDLKLLFGIALFCMIFGLCFLLFGIIPKSDFKLILGLVFVMVGIIIILVSMA